jgi:hypothetical protein
MSFLDACAISGHEQELNMLPLISAEPKAFETRFPLMIIDDG